MEQASGSEQNLLYRVARDLLQKRDYGELLARILDATIEALGADRGCVVVRENGKFKAVASRNFHTDALEEAELEISTSIANTAVEEGEVLLVGDAQEVGRFRNRGSVRRLGLRSVLCAPLVVSKEAFALVYLENRQVSNCFEERHRNLLREICSLAAPRLHTAVEIEAVRRRTRELELVWGEADGIVTADSGMASLLRTLTQVAATELPVLIQGETGTGKELIARAVYRRSKRASGPLVVVNCAAIPANLIESELFGHVRGAFTGADHDRVGLMGTANRGTLLLDEIGEMPLELQPRLLRVLQSGDFNRLGSVRSERVDVRVVAATNRDLQREVDEGRFRDDLYFRLAAVTLKIPPLRERPHDIHLLADHFLRVYAARWGREAPHLSRECLEALTSYEFPGNVRELESEMARLVAVSTPGEQITISMLNERIFRPRTGPVATTPQLSPMPLAAMERKLILAVLEHTAWNRTRAAEILGISREGLRTKMRRLDLTEVAPEN